MNPTRFESFADAYTPAVLAAVVELKPHLAGQRAEDYTLAAALAMLNMIQARGVSSVEHYVINTRGGAFRRTAEVLGVEPTARALQNYLEG